MQLRSHCVKDLLTADQWYAVLIALLANTFALLGIVLASHSNSRRERQQWLKQQRREAYVDHLKALDHMRNEFGNAAINLSDGLPRDELDFAALYGALEAYSRATELCLLVGSDDYCDALRKWEPNTTRLFELGTTGLPPDGDLNAFVRELTTIGDDVIQALRATARDDFQS